MLPAKVDEGTGKRKAWADMRDSSNESLGEPAPSRSGSRPKLFVANSFDSYCETPEKEFVALAENSRGALNRRLERLGRSASDVLMVDSQKDAMETSVAASGSSSSGWLPLSSPQASAHLASGALNGPSIGSAASAFTFGAPSPAAVAPGVATASTWRPNTQAREFVPSSASSFAVAAASAAPAAAASPSGAAASSFGAIVTRRRLQRKQSASGFFPARKRSRTDVTEAQIEEVAASPASASTPAARRRPQGTVATPSSRRGGRHPPAASEEDWQRRTEKRQAIIAGVKEAPEYLAYRSSSLQANSESPFFGTAAPRTPEATDRAISKRQWEDQVRQWRTQLRMFGPENGQEADEQEADME